MMLVGILVDGMDTPVGPVRAAVDYDNRNRVVVVVGHGHYCHSEYGASVVRLGSLETDDVALSLVFTCHLVRCLELFLVSFVAASSVVGLPEGTCSVVSPIGCSWGRSTFDNC